MKYDVLYKRATKITILGRIEPRARSCIFCVIEPGYRSVIDLYLDSHRLFTIIVTEVGISIWNTDASLVQITMESAKTFMAERDPARVTGGAEVNPRGDTRWYDVSNAGLRPVLQ